MAGIINDNGIQILNQYLASGMVSAGVSIGLFINNHTPAVGDNNGSYTEATFGGYSQQPLLTQADLGVVSHIDTQQFNPVVFVASGSGLPATCFGYFFYSLGKILAAQKFTASITLNAAGQAVVVVPTLSYQDRSIA